MDVYICASVMYVLMNLFHIIQFVNHPGLVGTIAFVAVGRLPTRCNTGFATLCCEGGGGGGGGSSRGALHGGIVGGCIIEAGGG